MKVVKQISELYDSKYELYSIIREKVDSTISNIKNERWHYESRIKNLESFAQKIETGRYSTRNIFEDFFACTIVVKNSTEIGEALEMLEKYFEIKSRRPREAGYTHKGPDLFCFDDLRLYVNLGDSFPNLDVSLRRLTFEIQIKTFLQHAWAIATHDLIYKSDEISWGKERVAYQVKASLEQAELMISSVPALSASEELSITSKSYETMNEIITFLKESWDAEHLPNDIKRLALNIEHLMHELGLALDDIRGVIDKENEDGRGVNSLNLSPYLSVVQGIFNQFPEKINEYYDIRKNNPKIFVTEDINTDMVDFKITKKLSRI